MTRAGTADWLARDSFCDGYQTESSPLSEPKGYTRRFDGPANESRELDGAQEMLLYLSVNHPTASRAACMFLEERGFE